MVIENAEVVASIVRILDEYDISYDCVDGGQNVSSVLGLQFVNTEILTEIQRTTGYENCEITSVKNPDGYFTVDLY